MHKKGSLEVICGPMFSGKSEELIRRLRRANIAQQIICVFKNKLDDRHTLEQVVSHDGNSLNAIAPENLETILKIAEEKGATVVGIDEVQFFSLDIIPIICTLIEQGKRVIVAGLDLDFRGAPFGCMPTLLAIADKVLKLQSICTLCGNDAHFTQRLVNNSPARYDDPIILIGAQETYQARCRSCFRIDKMFITPIIPTHENQNSL
jgi:thymidine kinase